jgi:hypothetical protein
MHTHTTNNPPSPHLSSFPSSNNPTQVDRRAGRAYIHSPTHPPFIHPLILYITSPPQVDRLAGRAYIHHPPAHSPTHPPFIHPLILYITSPPQVDRRAGRASVPGPQGGRPLQEQRLLRLRQVRKWGLVGSCVCMYIIYYICMYVWLCVCGGGGVGGLYKSNAPASASTSEKKRWDGGG